MRILLLSPDQRARYNWGHQLFRDSIKNFHDVTYYGAGFPNYNAALTVPQIIKSLDREPDIILTYGLRYTLPFKELIKITNIPKVHIVVDYFPKTGQYHGSWPRQHNFFKDNKFDLYFGVVGRVVKTLESNGVVEKAHLLPFSVNTNIYKKLNIPKQFDVMASYNARPDVYPLRKRIQRMVSRMQVRSFTKRVVHNKYVRMINQTRMVITSNNIFNSLSMKYTEALACGSFLFGDPPEDFSELGFKDGYHLVLYKSLDDLRDKILYYKENKKEREQIAANGMSFVRRNHSNEARVKQFTEIIEKELFRK